MNEEEAKSKSLVSEDGEPPALSCFWQTQYVNIAQPLARQTLLPNIGEHKTTSHKDKHKEKVEASKTATHSNHLIEVTNEPPREFPDFPTRKFLRRPSCPARPVKAKLLSVPSLPREAKECSAKNWRSFGVDAPRKLYRIPRKIIPPIKAVKVKKTHLVQVQAIRDDETSGEKLIINRQDSWEASAGRNPKRFHEKPRKYGRKSSRSDSMEVISET